MTKRPHSSADGRLDAVWFLLPTNRLETGASPPHTAAVMCGASRSLRLLVTSLFASVLASSGCVDDPEETSTGLGDDAEDSGALDEGGDGDGDGSGDGDDGGDGDDAPPAEGAPCEAVDPGWDVMAEVGGPAPHFEGIDQVGDNVSICKYEGKHIVLDVATTWCGPCNALAACLSVNEYDWQCDGYFGDPTPEFFESFVQPLRDAIANEVFGWVTIIVQDDVGQPPTSVDAYLWDAMYPNPNIHVFPDFTQQYLDHLPVMSFPSFWVIGPDMNYVDLNSDGVMYETIGSLL